MCIIVVKKLGVKFPSLKNLERCMEKNADGFSLAYWIEGKNLNIVKTMDKKFMLSKLRELKKIDDKKLSFTFHCRIATHGSVQVKNLHNFYDRKNKIAFCHNGVLYNIKTYNDKTDSEVLFRDYFLPIYNSNKETGLRFLDMVKSTSKFSILQNNGEIITFGSFFEEKGTLYSNNGFREYQMRYYHNWYDAFWKEEKNKRIGNLTDEEYKLLEKTGCLL